MIVYHQDNVAAFAGAHTHYWQFQPILQSRIAITSAAPPANTLIEQARGIHRFTFSRVFGRIN